MWSSDRCDVIVVIIDIVFVHLFLIIVPTTISLFAMCDTLVQELGQKEDDLDATNYGKP